MPYWPLFEYICLFYLPWTNKHALILYEYCFNYFFFVFLVLYKVLVGLALLKKCKAQMQAVPI